jgi:hypothetical protein
MKLVTDIAGGAGDLGGRVRRGFGNATRGGGATATDSDPGQGGGTDTATEDRRRDEE